MYITRFVLAICLIVLLGALACNKQNHNAMSDSDITQAVNNKLHSTPEVGASNIDVHTQNGVVHLEGKAISEEEARRAVQIASSVPGVLHVNSDLTVDTTITDKDIKDRVNSAEEATKKELDARTPESEHPINDAAITTKVKMKLAEDHLLSALEINVDTKNQVVTLTGNVKDQMQARRAVELAKAVDGVRDVNSVLTVKR